MSFANLAARASGLSITLVESQIEREYEAGMRQLLEDLGIEGSDVEWEYNDVDEHNDGLVSARIELKMLGVSFPFVSNEHPPSLYPDAHAAALCELGGIIVEYFKSEKFSIKAAEFAARVKKIPAPPSMLSNLESRLAKLQVDVSKFNFSESRPAPREHLKRKFRNDMTTTVVRDHPSLADQDAAKLIHHWMEKTNETVRMAVIEQVDDDTPSTKPTSLYFRQPDGPSLYHGRVSLLGLDFRSLKEHDTKAKARRDVLNTACWWILYGSQIMSTNEALAASTIEVVISLESNNFFNETFDQFGCAPDYFLPQFGAYVAMGGPTKPKLSAPTNTIWREERRKKNSILKATKSKYHQPIDKLDGKMLTTFNDEMKENVKSGSLEDRIAKMETDQKRKSKKRVMATIDPNLLQYDRRQEAAKFKSWAPTLAFHTRNRT